MAFARHVVPMCLVLYATLGHVLGESDSAGPRDLRHTDGGKETLSAQTDTTTLGPPPSADSLARHLKEIVAQQLRNRKHQWINACVALVVGLIMVIDGEVVFKSILVVAAFLVVSVVATSDIKAEWVSEDGDILRNIVGIEIGLVAAYAAWRGFEGLVIVVGALLGAVFAHWLQVSLQLQLFQKSGWEIVCLYSVCVAAGVVAFRSKRHAKALALLSSLVGGALVASAIAWATTFAAITFDLFHGLTPKGGAWLDFFDLLWNPSSTDVGVFAGSTYNLELRGSTWRSDRVAEVAVAVIFSYVGVSVQFNKLTAGKKVSAREPFLREALLSEA